VARDESLFCLFEFLTTYPAESLDNPTSMSFSFFDNHIHVSYNLSIRLQMSQQPFWYNPCIWSFSWNQFV